MNEYSGKDVSSLEEMLHSSFDIQERRKIRAALKEAQGLRIGNDGIITQSFNPKTLRKSSSDGSPLNSPKSPKSPLLKTSYRRQAEERTFQERCLRDNTKSKWFNSYPNLKEKSVSGNAYESLREKSFFSDRLKSLGEKSLQSDRSTTSREKSSYADLFSSLRDDIGPQLNKQRDKNKPDNESSDQQESSPKKERIPSWRESLKDEMERHSPVHFSSRSSKMSRALASDGVNDSQNYRSVYHIGSIGVPKKDGDLLNSDNNRRRNFISKLKTDETEISQNDFVSPRYSGRAVNPSEDNFTSPGKQHSKSDKPLQTGGRSSRLDCRSADSGYSSKSDRSSSGKKTTESDQSEFMHRSRLKLDMHNGSAPQSLFTSRTVWRSALQDKELSSRPLFDKSRSPSSERETTPRSFDRIPSVSCKMSRNKSDSNLVERASKTRNHSNSSQGNDLENDSVFDDKLNVCLRNSRERINESPLQSPLLRSLTRNHSDSNLSELSVISRTTSRASLYGSEDLSHSPVLSRKSSENDNTEVRDTRSKNLYMTPRETSPNSKTSSTFNRSVSSAELLTDSLLKDIHHRYSSDSQLIKQSGETTEDIDVEKEFRSVEEVLQEMSILQDKLKQSTDFASRRKIRAAIRKLREKREALESCGSAADKPSIIKHSVTASPCTREITPPLNSNNETPALLNGYTGVDSIPELRRLLSEESDYDEKRKIRHALRQLRQKKNEREGGGQPVNARNLGRSQSFVEQRQQNYKNQTPDNLVNGLSPSSTDHGCGVLQSSELTPNTATNGVSSGPSESVVHRRSSDVIVGSRTEKPDKETILSRRYSSFIPDSGLNVFKSSRQEGGKNHLKSFSSLETLTSASNSNCTVQPNSDTDSSKPSSSSSDSLSLPLKDRSDDIGGEKSESNQCQKPVTSKSNRKNHINRRYSLSSIGQPSNIKVKKTEKKSDDLERLGKTWIENKKRSCSLPGNDKNLKPVDMEAAFSELLSAVDKQDSVDVSNDLDLITEDINKNKAVNSEVIDELIRAGQHDAVLKREESDSVQQSNGVNGDSCLSLTPVTPQKVLDRPSFLAVTPDKSSVSLPEQNSAISIVEDDDGSVTVQNISHNIEGDQVITEKTRLRRTESNTETEERDTVIESKVTTPGGSAHYLKDITQSKRKLTTRGSDYFSKNKYVIKRTRNPSGDEIEEHDLSVETDNFSATKCEAWGDRAEAKVQMSRPGDAVQSLNGNIGSQVVTSKPPPAGCRMNISKTSSGYGSVSGSDEEEKEDVTSSANSGFQGRPSDYRRCSVTNLTSPSHDLMHIHDNDEDDDDGECNLPLFKRSKMRKDWRICSPEIRATLKDVVTLEGSTALLECTVMCSPDPTVTWFKGDKKVDKSARFEQKFDSTSGKASLSIKRAGVDDRGEYRCFFKNPLGEADTRAKLTVKTKAARKPEFKKRLKEQTVTEGCSVELACVVHDASHVSWYKDGIIQRNSADFKQTFDGITAKLEISEIFLDDKGEYACVAKNDLGESKTVCKINVKECTGDTNVVPTFLNKPGSKILNSNDTLLLECDIIGTPQPEIQWLKDGSKLSPTRGQRESYDGRVASLKIQSSTQEDSGKYECVATNEAGKASVDALVVIKAKQGPPIILHPLSDLSAPCGKPLTLQCDVRASPSPMISWRKDGRVIGNTKDFKQTYEDNMARLTIGQLYEADGGCYECVTRNSYGAVASMCNVTIIAADTVKPKSSPKLAQKHTMVDLSKTSPTDSGRQSDFRSALSKGQDSGVRRSASLRVPSNSVRDQLSKKSEEEDKHEKKLNVSNIEDKKFPVKTSLSPSTPEVTDLSKSKLSPVGDKSLRSDVNTERVSPLVLAQETKEPAWKNVKLRRAESARVTPTSRPSWWREKGESDIHGNIQPNKLTEEKPKQAVSPLASETPSKPPIVVEKTTPATEPLRREPVISSKANISLRRSESARLPMSNIGKRNLLARAIDLAMEKNKQTEINNNNNKMEVLWTEPSLKSSSSLPSVPSLSVQTSVQKSLITDTPTLSSEQINSQNNTSMGEKKEVKLSRTQSARLLFEKNCQSTEPALKPNSPVASFLAKQNGGLRRTSSLKVTPTEKEAGWFRNRHTKDDSATSQLSPLSKGEKDKNSLGSTTAEPAAMTNYDNMDDEEELHKILSKTEDFEERKKIRARMKIIREKKQKEWDEKRLQREKEHEDIIKKKYQFAEEQKKKKLEQFQKDAKTASAEREKILATSEKLIQDKLKQADEDKKRHMEVFEQLAQKGDTKSSTTVTTQQIPGGTRTTVIKKTETTGFGGISYGKPSAEQAAKFLSDQLKNAASTGTEGRISVKTESWSSRDGKTHTSQKTESWGVKAGGAMAGSKPNALVTLSYAKKAATTMRRNAGAIKQEILNFCKNNTKEYEGVEVTNFSSSWNNGMAFCALIHHFYPEAFDFKVLNPKARRANFKLAFDMAEKYADIAPLLDVDDMVAMKNPDWKCVFTYVQSYYRKLHNHAANKPASEQ